MQIISEKYTAILSTNLVGIYLHGSICFGCFNPLKSDIDFIVIIKDKMTLEVKIQLIKVLLDLKDNSPKKGLEMSIVLKNYYNPFEYPTPYELHYSNSHLESI